MWHDQYYNKLIKCQLFSKLIYTFFKVLKTVIYINSNILLTVDTPYLKALIYLLFYISLGQNVGQKEVQQLVVQLLYLTNRETEAQRGHVTSNVRGRIGIGVRSSHVKHYTFPNVPHESLHKGLLSEVLANFYSEENEGVFSP